MKEFSCKAVVTIEHLGLKLDKARNKAGEWAHINAYTMKCEGCQIQLKGNAGAVAYDQDESKSLSDAFVKETLSAICPQSPDTLTLIKKLYEI